MCSVMEIEVRRLDLLDVDELKTLFWECHTAEAKRKAARGIADLQTSIDGIPDYWEKWIYGIKRYYLSQVDEKHLMYGVFCDDRLMCILGWRCDLPAPYHRDWVVVYLKSVPDIDATKEYFPMLWRLMYDKCEKAGLIRIHALYEPHRISKYDAFSKRRSPDIDDKYTYETTLEIPAETIPDIEWVWAMMGRQIHPIDFIVRTGTLKNDNV